MTDGSQHPAIPMVGMGGGIGQGLLHVGPGMQHCAGGGGGGGGGGGAQGLKQAGPGEQQSFCFSSVG